MPDIKKTIADLDEQIAWIRDNDFHKFPGWGHAILAMKDAVELLNTQREREKAICKCICDFIRHGCSTDTDNDKDYVCNAIQQCFIRFGKGGENDE